MSNTFLWKPSSERTGTLAVLPPSMFTGNINSVDLVDPEGNVIETGNITSVGNGNRGTYRFRRPGSAYSPDVRVRINLANGDPIYVNSAGGRRYEQDFSSYSGSGNAPGYTEPSYASSPGGNPYVVPGAVNYGEISSPYVDMASNLALAQDMGEFNRDTYFENLLSSKPYAMDLLQTDIEGIQAGVNQLAPIARAQGDADTLTNMSRAGLIDQFNMSRIPGINAYNQEQIAGANAFNQQQFNEAIDAAGMDYRGRMGELIGNLSERARTGRMSGELDESLTRDLANRGSEFAQATGVGALSGAGIRANDRLTVQERLNLALGAEQSLPSVLQAAQQTLQFQPDRFAPTMAQMTDVPLNVSNIQDRVPIQSNISAGQAQQQIGTTATELQVIPAQAIFSAGLQTDQFNTQSQYIRDTMVADSTQNQLSALGSQMQYGLNQDLAQQIRDEAYAATRQGLDTRQRQQEIGAQGQLEGEARANEALAGLGLGGAAIRGMTNANPVISSILNGGSAPVGSIIDAIASVGDYVAGDRDGKLTVGGVEISSDALGRVISSIPEYFRNDVGSPTASYRGQAITGNAVTEDGTAGYMLEDGSIVSQDLVKSTARKENPYIDAMYPKSSDYSLLSKSSETMVNWDKLEPYDRAAKSSTLGLDVLADKGYVSPKEYAGIEKGLGLLTTMMDPRASDTDRAFAAADAIRTAVTTPFTGSPTAPNTINGERVIGQDNNSFITESGNTVPRTEVLSNYNTKATIEAFSVLMGNASADKKATALASLGIRAGVANNIVNQVNGGNMLAGLSIFNTATNWNQMNPFDRAISVMSTSASVSNSLASFGRTGARDAGNAILARTGYNMGNIGTAIGGVAGVVGGAAGVIKGVDQAGKTLEYIDDISRAHAPIEGAKGLGIAGAGIGGGLAGIAGGAAALGVGGGTMMGMSVGSAIFPVVGTVIGALAGALIGAVAGNFSTGKNTGQLLRDSWRNGLVQAGIAEKADGSMFVSLADGTKYDIGKDGGFKLQNKGVNIDGKTERNTFDIDWTNEAAKGSIPTAHLLNIATGLDQVTGDKHGLWDRTTGQIVNAATSNTDSIEGAKANIKSMLDKSGVSPSELIGRIETLRAGNRITEEQYGVYVNEVNSLYGTKLSPTPKEEAKEYLLKTVEANKKGRLNRFDKALYRDLTDSKVQKKNYQILQKYANRGY